MISATKDEAASVVAFLRWLGEPGAGIGTVYTALDELADRFELDDAVLLTDDEAAGVQLFRLSHRSIDKEMAARLIRSGPGLYTSPDVVPSTLHDAMLTVLPLAFRLQSGHARSKRDPVSGLGCRSDFLEALGIAAANGSRYGWSSTLVLLEMSDEGVLKARGEGNAPEALGDEMIGQIGHALKRLLRTGDVAGQLGPDRFGILLANSSTDATGAFVRRLRDELGVHARGKEIAAGAASVPVDSVDPDGLLWLASDRLR